MGAIGGRDRPRNHGTASTIREVAPTPRATSATGGTARRPQSDSNAKADQLVKQYDACKVLDDLHVNGRLTLGENLGRPRRA